MLLAEQLVGGGVVCCAGDFGGGKIKAKRSRRIIITFYGKILALFSKF
jgi:hypothetical protein